MSHCKISPDLPLCMARLIFPIITLLLDMKRVLPGQSKWLYWKVVVTTQLWDSCINH